MVGIVDVIQFVCVLRINGSILVAEQCLIDSHFDRGRIHVERFLDLLVCHPQVSQVVGQAQHLVQLIVCRAGSTFGLQHEQRPNRKWRHNEVIVDGRNGVRQQLQKFQRKLLGSSGNLSERFGRFGVRSRCLRCSFDMKNRMSLCANGRPREARDKRQC